MIVKVIALFLLIILCNKNGISKVEYALLSTVWVLLLGIFTLFFRDIGVSQSAVLIPFKVYSDLLQYTWHYSSKYTMMELLGNVLLFVPLGELLARLKKTKPEFVCFAAFCISLFIESCQFYFHIGCFEVDDLIHNTFGAYVGYQAILFKVDRKHARLASFGFFLIILFVCSFFSYLREIL